MSREEKLIIVSELQILGTPTEATWPGVSRLPLYKPQRLNFYRTQRLGHAFPRLYDISCAENLASKLLQVNSHNWLPLLYFTLLLLRTLKNPST